MKRIRKSCIFILLALSLMVVPISRSASAEGGQPDLSGQIRMGNQVTYWIHTDGTVAYRGYEFYGEAVAGLTDVLELSRGTTQTLVLDRDRSVWAWGSNFNGELGDSSYIDRYSPVKVAGLSDVAAIAASSYYSMALLSDGTVWAWGSNFYGKSGQANTSLKYPTPVRVGSLTNMTAIAACGQFSLALRQDGTVWSWGYNAAGELGDGTIVAQRSAPEEIQGLSSIQAIACGNSHAVALKEDGTVWTWGDNWNGQLGSADRSADYNRPVQVPSLTGVTAIGAGYFSTIALKNDGTVWTWGYNAKGLGDGSNESRRNPVQVPIVGVEEIHVGKQHTIVRKQDGTLWGWGNGDEGQLVNGSTRGTNLLPAPLLMHADTGIRSVQLSAGLLNPAFSPNKSIYDAEVGNEIASLTVTTGADDDTSLWVNGESVLADSPSGEIPLEVGLNVIRVEAANEAGRQMYSIEVTRAEPVDLSIVSTAADITLSAGTLSPAFAANITNYAVDVDKTVAAITVTVRALAPTATVSVNGQPAQEGQSSATVDLSIGSNAIPYRITSEDGQSATSGTLSVTRHKDRNTALANLSVEGGTIFPAFNKDVHEYYATLEPGVRNFAVHATAESSLATVKTYPTIGNFQQESVEFVRVKPGVNQMIVQVTAESGTSSRYTVNYVAPLANPEDPESLLPGDELRQWASVPGSPYIFMTTRDTNLLLVIDREDFTVVKAVQLGAPVPAFDPISEYRAENSDMDVVGSKLYMTVPGSNQVVVFDTELLSITDTITTTYRPHNLTVKQDKLYYASNNDGVWEYDFATKTERSVTDSFYGKSALALNETGDKLYIGETGTTGSSLHVLDTNDFTELARSESQYFPDRIVLVEGDYVYYGNAKLNADTLVQVGEGYTKKIAGAGQGLLFTTADVWDRSNDDWLFEIPHKEQISSIVRVLEDQGAYWVYTSDGDQLYKYDTFEQFWESAPEHSAPAYEPFGLAFTDTNPAAGQLAGTLSWFGPVNSEFIEWYAGYFLDADDRRIGGPLFEVQKDEVRQDHSYSFAEPVAIPPGAVKIAVYAGNAHGIGKQATTILIQDTIQSGVPVLDANALFVFIDKDVSKGSIGGPVYVIDIWSQDAPAYVAYFLSEDGVRIGPQIAETTDKNNFYIPSGMAIPEGAKQIGFYVRNSFGDSLTNKAIDLWDEPYLHAVDGTFYDADGRRDIFDATVTWKPSMTDPETEYYQVGEFWRSGTIYTPATVLNSGSSSYAKKIAVSSGSEAVMIQTGSGMRISPISEYVTVADNISDEPIVSYPADSSLPVPIVTLADLNSSMERISGKIEWSIPISDNGGPQPPAPSAPTFGAPGNIPVIISNSALATGASLYYLNDAGEKLAGIVETRGNMISTSKSYTLPDSPIPPGAVSIGIFAMSDTAEGHPAIIRIQDSGGEDTPAWPEGSQLKVLDRTQSSVELEWTPVLSQEPVAYLLWQDGVLVAELPGNETRFLMTGLATDTLYQFRVKALTAEDRHLIAGDVNAEVTLLESDAAGASIQMKLDWLAGSDDSPLARLIRSRADDMAVYSLFDSLKITLRKNGGDSGITVQSKHSGIWKADGGPAEGRALVLTGIPSAYTTITIEGSSMLPLSWSIDQVPAAHTLIFGDYNHSGSIDLEDYDIWLQGYRMSKAAASGYEDIAPYDLTRDGIVNNLDFSMWLRELPR